MMRLTSRPAILPASLVAWRCASLKYAGTVMTALSTVSPRYASASCLSFCRIIALISGGEYSLSPANTRASPFWPETTRKGTIVSSSLTSASLRPMKRLTENTVFSGLVTACRLATVPTRRSPPPVKATTEGVVRAPSAFSTTVGSPPSSTAMHELVVPRSMPIVLPIQVPPARCSDSKSESEDGRFVLGRPPSLRWQVTGDRWQCSALTCKVSARRFDDIGVMSTSQRLLILCAAVLVAALFGQPAADARGLPPKQKFEVTYKAEYGQDWYAYGDDNQNWDYAEQCVVGMGGSGSSEFHAERKRTVVSLPADAKKGTIYGQVPVEAWLYRKVTLGQKPPDDCDETYLELASRLDCDSQSPQWGLNGNPPAYLDIIAGKGVVSTDVAREKEQELIAEILP